MTLNRLFEVVKLKERPAGFVPEDTPFKKDIEIKSEFTFSEVSEEKFMTQDERDLMNQIPKEYFVKFKIDPER